MTDGRVGAAVGADDRVVADGGGEVIRWGLILVIVVLVIVVPVLAPVAGVRVVQLVSGVLIGVRCDGPERHTRPLWALRTYAVEVPGEPAAGE